MAQFDIDFSNIQSTDPLPKGQYLVNIDSVTMKASQNSEHPYLNWRLTVIAEEEEQAEWNGRTLFFMTSLSPKALWRLQSVFEALGTYQEKMSLEVDEDSGLVLSPQFAETTAIAHVIQEPYQGRMQNRVENLTSAAVQAPAPELAKPAVQPAVNRPATAPAAAKKGALR